jgi:hypothetical protein
MSRPRLTAAAASAAVLALLALPAGASAHGIAQRADLPIPEWLFAWGAALVLLASFAALAVLWPRPVLAGLGERHLVTVPRALEVLAGLLGIGAFGAVVYAGLAGNQTATANLAPTAIFVLFWVGIPVASVLVGDVWAAVSPWRALARGAGWVAQRVAGPGGLPEPMAYPERLGRLPAAAGVVAFAWVELVYVNRDVPESLALLALGYALVMLVGMSLYGVEPWTRNADAFGVAFGLLALLAPLRWERRRVALRAPLAGAVRMPQVAGASAVVLALIGTTTFDGFSQGGIWTGEDGLAQRLTDAFEGAGLGREVAVQAAYTVGLLLIVTLVAGLYRLGVAGMRSVGGPEHDARDLSRRFAHALIPIAFAYLLAHYFSLLAFQGQALGYLVSDPLGDGSDLFGTASATIDYGLVSANAIWYVQVAALVIGHIGGLVLAHDRALETWSEPRTATRSQYWMLLVMIAFTCLGLWILSAASQ